MSSVFATAPLSPAPSALLLLHILPYSRYFVLLARPAFSVHLGSRPIANPASLTLPRLSFPPFTAPLLTFPLYVLHLLPLAFLSRICYSLTFAIALSLLCHVPALQNAPLKQPSFTHLAPPTLSRHFSHSSSLRSARSAQPYPILLHFDTTLPSAALSSSPHITLRNPQNPHFLHHRLRLLHSSLSRSPFFFHRVQPYSTITPFHTSYILCSVQSQSHNLLPLLCISLALLLLQNTLNPFLYLSLIFAASRPTKYSNFAFLLSHISHLSLSLLPFLSLFFILFHPTTLSPQPILRQYFQTRLYPLSLAVSFTFL